MLYHYGKERGNMNRNVFTRCQVFNVAKIKAILGRPEGKNEVWWWMYIKSFLIKERKYKWLKKTLEEALKNENFLQLKLNKGSIKLAQKMLQADETILYAGIRNIGVKPIVNDLKPNPYNIKDKMAGVFVITDKRVLCCENALIRNTFKQIAIDKVQSVDTLTMIFSQIRITGLTDMFIVDTKNEKDTLNIANALEQARNNISDFPYAEKNSVSCDDKSTERIKALKDLKELLDSGVLTKEEFVNEKARILND